MNKTVTLSSGEIVHFHPWKRKAQKTFMLALRQGVFFQRNLDTGEVDPTEKIPASNYDLAYEAVLPLLISRIEQGGGEIPFTESWRDDLAQPDYERLERAVFEIKAASRDDGEKKA